MVDTRKHTAYSMRYNVKVTYYVRVEPMLQPLMGEKLQGNH